MAEHTKKWTVPCAINNYISTDVDRGNYAIPKVEVRMRDRLFFILKFKVVSYRKADEYD